MKLSILAKGLCAAALQTCSLEPQAGNLLPEPQEAPIPLITGKSVSLSDYKGKKPVYLKFWASWCQPCLKEMPHFENTYEIYGESIVVIGINLGINETSSDLKRVREEYGLTMPLAVDKSGDLAQVFRLVGTPYHLLFDRQMNLVHQGHEASESLDRKIDLLVSDRTVELLDSSLFSETEPDIELTLNDGKTHALFFTSTWCDWYLMESRPAVSQRCVLAQKRVNQLSEEHPEIEWHGIISRLWTEKEDLAEYKKKYAIAHPIEIDKSNRLFHRYGVRALPQLVLVRNGKEIARLHDFHSRTKLPDYLEKQ